MITESQRALKSPLFRQPDLRNILDAAARIVGRGKVAPRLHRNLCRWELQLLAVCGDIGEIVVGQLGRDLYGEPLGDLTLKAQPYVPAVYRPKLRPEDNGH